jgi:hypothetical protein
MPYLRLYSRDLAVDQKRVIAQKLIEITLRTFHLSAAERNRITIQFLPQAKPGTVARLMPLIPRDADATLEIMAHNLTEGKKRAFVEEATATLGNLVPGKSGSRIASWLRLKGASPRKIALQYFELSPAISDPFVVDTDNSVASSDLSCQPRSEAYFSHVEY